MTRTDELASAKTAEQIYQAGYDAAVNDATRWLRDVYVPAPVRWRHVCPGDTFTDPKGRLWHVQSVIVRPAGVDVVAVRGDASFDEKALDLDETVLVLEPLPMDDALALTRAELGAQIIERRTT